MINGNYPASLCHKFIRLLDHRYISILVDNSIDKKVSKILNLIPSKINQINSILTNYPFPCLVTFTDNRKVRYIFDIKEEVLREILTDNKLSDNYTTLAERFLFSYLKVNVYPNSNNKGNFLNNENCIFETYIFIDN